MTYFYSFKHKYQEAGRYQPKFKVKNEHGVWSDWYFLSSLNLEEGLNLSNTTVLLGSPFFDDIVFHNDIAYVLRSGLLLAISIKTSSVETLFSLDQTTGSGLVYVFDADTILVVISNVYNSQDHGVYKTTNRGQTWTKVLTTSTEFRNAVFYNGNLYILATDKVYYTSNRGDTWNYYSLPQETRKMDVSFGTFVFQTYYTLYSTRDFNNYTYTNTYMDCTNLMNVYPIDENKWLLFGLGSNLYKTVTQGNYYFPLFSTDDMPYVYSHIEMNDNIYFGRYDGLFMLDKNECIDAVGSGSMNVFQLQQISDTPISKILKDPVTQNVLIVESERNVVHTTTQLDPVVPSGDISCVEYKVSEPLVYYEMQYAAISFIDPAGNVHFLASMFDPETWDPVIRHVYSDDGNVTWKACTVPTLDGYYIADMEGTSVSSSKHVIAIYDRDICLTTDNFNTCNVVSVEKSGYITQKLVVNPSNEMIYILMYNKTTNATVFATAPLSSPTDITIQSTVSSSAMNSFMFVDLVRNRICVIDESDDKIYKSSDGGMSWSTVSVPTGVSFFEHDKISPSYNSHTGKMAQLVKQSNGAYSFLIWDFSNDSYTFRGSMPQPPYGWFMLSSFILWDDDTIYFSEYPDAPAIFAASSDNHVSVYSKKIQRVPPTSRSNFCTKMMRCGSYMYYTDGYHPVVYKYTLSLNE